MRTNLGAKKEARTIVFGTLIALQDATEGLRFFYWRGGGFCGIVLH